MAQSGFPFDYHTVSDLELAYIGGLLKLDLQIDEEAREEVFAQVKNRRRASPLRKR